MNDEITVEKIKGRIAEKLRGSNIAHTNDNQGHVQDNTQTPFLILDNKENPNFIKGRFDSFLWKYGKSYAKIILKIPILKSIAKGQYFRLVSKNFNISSNLPPTDDSSHYNSINVTGIPYSYHGFLEQTKKEGLKGRIKLFLFKFIGFTSVWQQQINTALFQEIANRQAETEGKLIQMLAQAIAKQQAEITDNILMTNWQRQINNTLFKEMDKQQAEMEEKSIQQIDNVLITKGQINGDSYLSKALESSTSSLHDLMQKNKDEDVFYYLLENLFRGSIDDIKNRQTKYLPYITDVYPDSKGKFFLDLGCGRGEFLSLLKEHGIPAKGVDTNGIFNELLKRKGIDVIQSDALEFLHGLKDNVLIGLSMFQIIEHFNFKYVDAILKTASTKISQGGIIIVESVNPSCPIAVGNFYIDPTHVTLYSPDTLKFILEYHGFDNIRIVYSSPTPKSQRFKEAVMNYQDYAVIGEKQSGKKSIHR